MFLKKKNLSEGSNYIIAAIGISTFIEIYNIVRKYVDDSYTSVTSYVIGVNLITFLLFFLYFQRILISKKSKNINLTIIILFLASYLYFAITTVDFFSKFPFFSYFVEVILLTGSIYLVMSQTFNSDKILFLGNYFPFWVCMSLLVTYLGVLPLLIASRNASNLMNLNIFFAILFVVNVMGYLILLVGIIKMKRK